MDFATDAELGAFWDPARTVFRLWAPEAAAVEVRLYAAWDAPSARQTLALHRGPEGVWSAALPGDWSGFWYTYGTDYEGRGPREGVDPYARAVGPGGRRGFLFDARGTDPPGWAEDRPPPLAHVVDSVIYEVHVRDLTSQPSSGCRRPGTFLGFAEEGTLSPDGLPTGLDHVASLGVTHVHLLPVFDFDGLDDLAPGGDEYNWGYNPRNFNAPKPAYASDPRRPETGVRDLKVLVQTLHQRGLRVVLDVVYNHTFATEDSALGVAYPLYYYRLQGTAYANGSGCGNEVATERPMARRYILDSLRYWQSEFHVDGFRFDLMGLYDVETMAAIRAAFPDPGFLLYGEGWTGGPSPLAEDQRAVKAQAARLPGLAFFSDELRDAVKGPVFEAARGGLVNGGPAHEAVVLAGLAGRPGWALGPDQVVNYVAAHDNHTLSDKIALTCPQAPARERQARLRLAHGAVFLAQGLAFLHAGEEFQRTKQGIENSYRSPESINGLDWTALAGNEGLTAYLRGLIRLRRSRPELRHRSAAAVQAGFRVLPPTEGHLLVWSPGPDLFIVLNARQDAATVPLPRGTWVPLADGHRAGAEALGPPQLHSLTVPALSLAVLSRSDGLA